MNKKNKQEFTEAIPDLLQLDSVPEPSSDWLANALDQLPKQKKRNVLTLFMQQLFELLYLPKPSVAVPLLICAGILSAQLLANTPIPESPLVDAFIIAQGGQ